MTKSKLFIGQLQGEESKWLMFVSDGTRKDMRAEFLDVWNCERDEEETDVKLVEIWSLEEAYDYTEKKNYKLMLKQK